LFYDEIDKNIVVWELKSDRVGIPEAKIELEVYVTELERLFLQDEKERCWEAFGLPLEDLPFVKKVKGYIVCPRKEDKSDKPVNEKFGLCVFDCPVEHVIIKEKLYKPWEHYSIPGLKMKLNFTII
jgi:hypothetical protein